MRLPARSVTWALLAATLLVAPATAGGAPVSGQLVAQGLRFEAAADQQGPLVFLHAHSDGAVGAVPTLHVAGHRIAAEQYDETGVEADGGDVGGPAVDTLRLLDSVQPPQPRRVAADEARLDLEGQPTAYQVNAFPTSLAAPPEAHATLTGGQQSVLQDPVLSSDGIYPRGSRGAGVLPSAPQSSAPSFWSHPPAGGPHVVNQASAATVHLAGTFTVEVIGFDLHLAGEGQDADLHSGTSRPGLAPVPVGALDGHLHAIRQSFLRINVTDGTLDLGVPAARLVQWSGPAVESTTADAVALSGATGTLLLSDGQRQQLTGAAYRLDGRFDLAANPAQQGLQLAVTGLDAHGQPLVPSTTTVRVAAAPPDWAVALAVAASAGAALLALALRRRQPTMRDVEAALEAGHFRRAARDAARLLRSRPHFEDAVLSRSIALSRLGRNRRVVREVHAHFAAQEPSDGVLHYVLGLALRETGAAEAAQAALREALRRTPGLLPQVQPLLSGQQPSSPASALGPAVDGTAYA